MKTLKIKLPEAVDAYVALANLISKNDFPFEIAWELEDILEVLEKHNKRFEEARTKLLKEYAIPDGEPNAEGKQSFQIKDQKKFQEGMLELIKVDIELKFEPISYDKLKSVPNLTVNSQDLSVLRKHIIEKASNDLKVVKNGKAKKE